MPPSTTAAMSILSQLVPAGTPLPTLGQILYPTTRSLSKHRSRPSNSPSTPGQTPPPTRISLPNPFLPSTSSSGGYTPPALSARRRADLVRFFGKERLPAPYGHVVEEEWDVPASEAGGVVPNATGTSEKVRIRWVNPTNVNASSKPVGSSSSSSSSKIPTSPPKSSSTTPTLPQSTSSNSTSTPPQPTSTSPAPAPTLTHGPYSGRPHVQFKGHKHAIAKVQRRKDVGERMDGPAGGTGAEEGKRQGKGKAMEDRVEAWRKSKREAIASAKPSLPF